jgi:hypothetical protein
MSSRPHTRFAATLALACWVTISLAAPLYDERLCLVDVMDGKPTEADFHDAWRMVSDVVLFPARVPPLIMPVNRRGAWTVDESRRFVPYPEPVPSLASTQHRHMWTADPNTGRIVALGGRDRGLLSANRDDGHFTRIHDTAPLGIDYFRAPLHVSRLGGTLIAATNGVLLLKGDKLEQLPLSDQLAPVFAMTDSPRLGAIIFVTVTTPKSDSGLFGPSIQITARTDNDLWKGDYFLGFDVVHNPERVVIRTKTTEWLLPISKTQEALLGSRIIPLGSRQHNKGRYLASVDRYVISGWTGGFLGFFQEYFLGFFQKYSVRNLGPYGYEEIPGDTMEPKFDGTDIVGVTEVPWRRVAIFSGKQGLYVYDGKRMSRIPGSDPHALGGLTTVYAVPSIGKVILTTARGIFDLSPNGTITRIPVPNVIDRGFSTIGDMPGSRLGLISPGDGNGIYSLDAHGVVRLIPGSETEAGSSPFRGVIPIRNEMLVVGLSGLHLLVDRTISGSTGCPVR